MRFLDAHHKREDWEVVPRQPPSRTMARGITVRGPEVKQRGDSRDANVKGTQEIEEAMVSYVEETCC
ncbi:hypothetical protein ON010_g1600 [Phytophthora cinnamomi]|nr:hypothetical protein ON010_g1600 [Phytophthora cinnamomi]